MDEPKGLRGRGQAEWCVSDLTDNGVSILAIGQSKDQIRGPVRVLARTRAFGFGGWLQTRILGPREQVREQLLETV